MTLNIICFILITTCGTLIGLEMRGRLSIRTKSLNMFREIFREIKAIISYNGLALIEIVPELEKMHENNEFIANCSKNMALGSFKAAWTHTIDELKKELCLNDDDVKFLCDSAERLGKSDIDSELELLELINSQLSDKICEADEKLKSDGKIYTTLGTSCGIIAALLII